MNTERKKSRTSSIANRLNGHFRRRDFFKTVFLDLIVCCAVLLTWGLTVESLHGGRISNVSDRRLTGLRAPDSWRITEWFTDVRYCFTVFDPSSGDYVRIAVASSGDDGASSDVSEETVEFTAETEGLETDVVDFDGVETIFVATAGAVAVEQNAATALTMLTFGALVAAAAQLFFFICGSFTGRRAIKKFLRPIDDIALTAERISAESLLTSEREISSMRQANSAKMRNLEESINEIGAFDERIDVGDSELGGLEAAVNNMLKRLAESNRKQIRFVDDASHELRTPIAVIQGYANMLDRWGKDDPKVMEESIGAIKTESEHMKTLVDQLLFLARGDMDRLVLSEERVSLADLTEEIYEESVMIDTTHEYRLILPETDADISVDLAMFKQCVRILIDNAVKYTPAGGDVILKSYAAGGKAYIEVTDSGEGISREDMPHIFDRFYRSASARGKQGSGLGLSIARWIVEKHGGRIDAVSRAGVGSRMTVVVNAMGTAGGTP